MNTRRDQEAAEKLRKIYDDIIIVEVIGPTKADYRLEFKAEFSESYIRFKQARDILINIHDRSLYDELRREFEEKRAYILEQVERFNEDVGPHPLIDTSLVTDHDLDKLRRLNIDYATGNQELESSEHFFKTEDYTTDEHEDVQVKSNSVTSDGETDEAEAEDSIEELSNILQIDHEASSDNPEKIKINRDNINKKIDKDGNTVLHLAVMNFDVILVERLLKTEGIDPELKNAVGKTARDVALKIMADYARLQKTTSQELIPLMKLSEVDRKERESEIKLVDGKNRIASFRKHDIVAIADMLSPKREPLLASKPVMEMEPVEVATVAVRGSPVVENAAGNAPSAIRSFFSKVAAIPGRIINFLRDKLSGNRTDASENAPRSRTNSASFEWVESSSSQEKSTKKPSSTNLIMSEAAKVPLVANEAGKEEVASPVHSPAQHKKTSDVSRPSRSASEDYDLSERKRSTKP